MKNVSKMKYNRYWLLPFFLLLFSVGSLQAQPGGDGDGDGDDPTVPIDGGISFLLVAGAAYGVKKVLDNKK